MRNNLYLVDRNKKMIVDNLIKALTLANYKTFIKMIDLEDQKNAWLLSN